MRRVECTLQTQGAVQQPSVTLIFHLNMFAWKGSIYYNEKEKNRHLRRFLLRESTHSKESIQRNRLIWIRTLVARSREETKRVRQVSARMSTFASSVKSKCSQGKVNTERGSAPVENSSTQREKAGWVVSSGFQRVELMGRLNDTVVVLYSRVTNTVRDEEIWRQHLGKKWLCLSLLHAYFFLSITVYLVAT